MESETQNNLIPSGIPRMGLPITVSSTMAEYCQECDVNSDEMQKIKISTEDNGAGVFFVIETERWSFDNVDNLINLLNDFKKRLGDNLRPHANSWF